MLLKLTTRRVRQNQPPCVTGIDWENPITRDIHHAITFAEGGKSYLATKLGTQFADGAHNYSNTVRARGRAGVFAGGAATSSMGVASTSPLAVPSTNTFSILHIARVTGAGGASNGNIWKCNNNIQFYGGTVQATKLNNGQWNAAYSLSVDHVAVLTGDLSVLAVNSKQWYVDGVSASFVNAAGANTLFPMVGEFAWGNNVITGGIRALQGEIVLGVLALRVWTVAEIISLSANPWQIFKPPRRPILEPTKLAQVAPILAQ